MTSHERSVPIEFVLVAAHERKFPFFILPTWIGLAVILNVCGRLHGIASLIS